MNDILFSCKFDLFVNESAGVSTAAALGFQNICQVERLIDCLKRSSLAQLTEPK